MCYRDPWTLCLYTSFVALPIGFAIGIKPDRIVACALGALAASDSASRVGLVLSEWYQMGTAGASLWLLLVSLFRAVFQTSVVLALSAFVGLIKFSSVGIAAGLTLGALTAADLALYGRPDFPYEAACVPETPISWLVLGVIFLCFASLGVIFLTLDESEEAQSANRGIKNGAVAMLCKPKKESRKKWEFFVSLRMLLLVFSTWVSRNGVFQAGLGLTVILGSLTMHVFAKP